LSSNNTIVKLDDLAFRWPKGQRNTLEITELSINRGESLFLKGQSGSGKTTLLSLLGGINIATGGRVEVLGQDIAAMKPRQRDQFRADHIGFIFQLFNLIPYLSVVDNILLACRFSEKRAKKVLLKGSTLIDEAHRLLEHLGLDPNELEHKPVLELSVGQQQRVATARALIGGPDLIIADEPTSALDADAQKQFLQLLNQECQAFGSTLVFVSHDSSLESQFQHTLELSDINKVVAEASL